MGYPIGKGIVNEPSQHPVLVYDVGGASEFLWTQAPDNDLSATGSTLVTHPVDHYYEVDYAAGTIKLGSSSIPGGKCLDADKDHIIEIVYSHDFDVSQGVEAWISDKQKVVKLDLNTITEANCPRDPKYKSSIIPIDRQKYGVIFSEVPLVVWGTPKVPVTIVCTKDLYVGPINAAQLDPNDISKWWIPKDPNLVEDSKDANPVGIITSGILFYDFSLGVSGTTPSSMFFPGIGASVTLNKVAIYHSLREPPPVSTSDSDRLGMLGMASGFRPEFNTNNYNTGLYATAPTIVGSLYHCIDSNVVADALTKKLSDEVLNSSSARVIYANSFRRTPPQHMPMNIYLTNYRILSKYDNAEKFLDNLSVYLATDPGSSYTQAFSKMITDLVAEMEGVVVEE